MKTLFAVCFCWMVPLAAAMANGMDPRVDGQKSSYWFVLKLTWSQWWEGTIFEGKN